MYRSAIKALIICILSASLALAGDLYLLTIDNPESLETVKGIADYAHGTINNKFVVELNSDQVKRLDMAGIRVELIQRGWTPERTFLVSRMHPELAMKEFAGKWLYVSENDMLADLTQPEADNLKKDGYCLIPISEKKTPFFCAPVLVSALWPDIYPNDTLANRIRQDSIYNYNLRLEQFRTRYIYADSVYAARDWLVDKFLSFGYTDVSYDSFDYYGRICNNVICKKPGAVDPDNILVVGAHYDSFNQDSDPMVYAPGADDNGSGVAAVLELARVLKDIPMKKSVMFVAFSAEEVGLVGSNVVASNLYYSGAKVEFMVNFDMIGFTADAQPDVALYHGFSSVYASVFSQAALRVTDLQPYLAGSAGNSDHASFDQFGFYTTYVQEGDFNTAGWHHNADLTSNMDFPYTTKQLKMSVAALGQIDLAARSTRIDNILDLGDGQGLRVVWNNDCQVDYTYKVMYGIQSKIYTDTVDVPAGNCSFDLDGLTLGQKYYISVLGINAEGHGPVYASESSGTPYEVPREPTYLRANPDLRKIVLTWRANKEVDLDRYILLRRTLDGEWARLKDSIVDTSYADTTALPHLFYDYSAQAVDNSGNFSDSSAVSGAVAASFDGGMLFVEETFAGGMDPTHEQQESYYDSIFAGQIYSKYYFDSIPEAPSRSTAGQYGSIIWLDDDVSEHLFVSDLDSVRWYLGYDSTDIFLAGNETVFWLTGPNPLNPGNFIYDNFGIMRATENWSFDFTGATGLSGWPTLHVNPSGIFGAALTRIAVFDTLPGAQVIYTYNSSSGNPSYQGKPAGVIYQAHGGKRIALSFPIYYLYEAEAQALLAKVFDYFEKVVPSRPYGDANNDGHINMLDITFVINFLYKNGMPPSDLDYADPNGSCHINALDVTYLIAYLYKGGPAPVAGCVP